MGPTAQLQELYLSDICFQFQTGSAKEFGEAGVVADLSGSRDPSVDQSEIDKREGLFLEGPVGIHEEFVGVAEDGIDT